jgi:Zn-dependent M28 family amino/carboxypeptidase
LLYAGFGIEDENYSDYINLNVKGKYVLIKEGVPESVKLGKEWINWRRKVKVAKSKGALGLITIKKNYTEEAERMAGFIENPNMQMHNPGVRVAGLMPNIYISDSIANTFLSNITESKISIKVDIKEELTSDNVLGYIEGTDLKDELVVITAHYDHLGYDNGEVCNGADDDGSGTVSVIELAEAFQKAKNAGNGPRRSILFMTVSGEEKGLWGSKYYSENPVYD